MYRFTIFIFSFVNNLSAYKLNKVHSKNKIVHATELKRLLYLYKIRFYYITILCIRKYRWLV
jgi:hypothetical protein